jgi:hypothetical protein
MSGGARKLVAALGALAFAGGLALTVAGVGGVPLVILGALVLGSLVLEQRYGRPGKQRSVPHSDWQLTQERFIDDETGEPVEVWVDPLTGERRYEPLGDHPRISDPRTHR